MPGRKTAMQRRLATSGVAAVHHVVVDKRARVQQLECGSGGNDLRTVPAARSSPAPVAERGPQPFATGEQGLDRGNPWQQFLPSRE